MGKQKAIIQRLKTGLALNPCLCSVLLKKTNKQKLSFNKLFYLFIFGCAGSLLLHGLFSSCGEQGATLCCREQASHRCETHRLWSTGSTAVAKGLAALRHVESSKSVSLISSGGFFPSGPLGKPWPHLDYIFSKQQLQTRPHSASSGSGLQCLFWEDAIQLTTDIKKNKQTNNSGFPGGPVIKNSPCNAETLVWSLVWEYPTGCGAAQTVHHSYGT